MKGELTQQKRANGCGAIARNPGILIADGMALVLTLLKFELEARSFEVWLAVDGDDAIDLYRRHRREIDLVLLDVQMPGLDGARTLEVIQRLNPDVYACFTSEQGAVYTEEELRGRGAAGIFRKPFHPAEVADALQRILSGPDFPPFVGDGEAPSGREIEPCTLWGKWASTPVGSPARPRGRTTNQPTGGSLMELQLDHLPRKEGASGSVLMVRFTGGKVLLDEETLCGIRDKLLALADEPSAADVVFDFGNVEYLSSTTLGTLVRLRKKLHARGRRLTIGNLTPQVHEIFAVTRLDRVFDLRFAKQETQPVADVGWIDS
jgi:anti-sigma B factor antagonist